jgi:hypothetical protein
MFKFEVTQLFGRDTTTLVAVYLEKGSEGANNTLSTRALPQLAIDYVASP